MASDSKKENKKQPSRQNSKEDSICDDNPNAEIDELQEKLAEEQDKRLRLQADFENYRKRMIKELGDAQWYGKRKVLEPILSVFDTFDLALKATETVSDDDPLKAGIQMIYKEFNKALKDLNIVRIDAYGTAFDPELHEAVAYEESDKIPEGMVIQQWNCGYKSEDMLIRPARVVVSSGNKTEKDENDQED